MAVGSLLVYTIILLVVGHSQLVVSHTSESNVNKLGTIAILQDHAGKFTTTT